MNLLKAFFTPPDENVKSLARRLAEFVLPLLGICLVIKFMLDFERHKDPFHPTLFLVAPLVSFACYMQTGRWTPFFILPNRWWLEMFKFVAKLAGRIAEATFIIVGMYIAGLIAVAALAYLYFRVGVYLNLGDPIAMFYLLIPLGLFIRIGFYVASEWKRGKVDDTTTLRGKGFGEGP